MATKQTRRSISVRGTTYDTLRKFCEKSDRSMSDIVEEQLAQLFGKGGVAKAAAKPLAKPAPKARTVAHKLLRAPAPVAVAVAVTAERAGRPAPTPANEVIPERVRAPKGDYRTIRF